MGSVVLHRGLFRLNATCITVALHYSNGRRANSQHSSTQNSHFSRLCACDCLVFKMVIEKTPFHAGTGAGIFPPLSPAKKLLLSILHCDNGISGKRDIRRILNLLHTEIDIQLRHIAIMTMMILAACGGRNSQKNKRSGFITRSLRSVYITTWLMLLFFVEPPVTTLSALLECGTYT